MEEKKVIRPIERSPRFFLNIFDYDTKDCVVVFSPGHVPGAYGLGDQGEKKNRQRRAKSMQPKAAVYKRRQKREEKKLHLDVLRL